MTDLEALNFLVLTIHAYERLLRAQPSNTHAQQLIHDCELARQWLINTATRHTTTPHIPNTSHSPTKQEQ